MQVVAQLVEQRPGAHRDRARREIAIAKRQHLGPQRVATADPRRIVYRLMRARGRCHAVGGVGTAGIPDDLIDALIACGAGGLTIINNNAGNGETGVTALIEATS